LTFYTLPAPKQRGAPLSWSLHAISGAAARMTLRHHVDCFYQLRNYGLQHLGMLFRHKRAVVCKSIRPVGYRDLNCSPFWSKGIAAYHEMGLTCPSLIVPNRLCAVIGLTNLGISMIPAQILNQVNDRSTEGLALALASNDDGAVMELQWCNKAFTRITGYEAAEAVGQRGTILIGQDMGQDVHLYIIEKLMNWENFSVKSPSNRKGGDIYWQRMSWVHLSDPETGNHWWLCSIIELEEELALPTQSEITDPVLSDQKTYSKVVERIHRLEKENTRLHELAKSVSKDANEDALTGLSNRRHFEVELKTWIEQLKKHGTEFAVLYLDLDRFKFVNDTLGHEAGDRLLISVAKMLRELTGKSDLVARLGGDEFIILKKLGKTALNISGLADEIVLRMQIPVTSEGKSAICSASIGVAIASANMEDPSQVVADSDEALYHAKSHGKGRWSFFTQEMHTNSIATKQMASDLLLACERCEFVPYRYRCKHGDTQED
jgi:diguanylate cyclase (GGDEF)-like protein/PAS domain S-box-containing protein